MKKVLVLLILLLTYILYRINLFGDGKIIHSSDRCLIKTIPLISHSFFKNKLYVVKIFKSRMNFDVVTSNEGNYDFYINSNFFSKTGPLGEVKSNGQILNNSYSRGGYFSGVGSKFNITSKKQKNTSYSSQTHLMGIINGNLNKKIFHNKFGKLKTHRILVGNDKNGNLVIIHSDYLSKINLEELCILGKNEGILNGLIYDGGSSIEIKIKDGSFIHKFHTLPNVIKKVVNIHKPFVYIVGNFN